MQIYFCKCFNHWSIYLCFMYRSWFLCIACQRRTEPNVSTQF